MLSIVLSLTLSMLNCEAPNIRKDNVQYCHCLDDAKREQKVCYADKKHDCYSKFQKEVRVCESGRKP